MDKKRAGTITFEEAQTQLKELVLTLPDKDHDKVAGLDAGTKAKAQKQKTKAD